MVGDYRIIMKEYWIYSVTVSKENTNIKNEDYSHPFGKFKSQI
jgi:hypothetical protein